MADDRHGGKGRRVKIGIALGGQEATAVVAGGRGTPSATVSGDFRADRPELFGVLCRAFGELREALETRTGRSVAGARVHVALLPPLADARVIPFPPMRQTEAEMVLSRDVTRYFLGATRAQVVSVHRLHGGETSEEGRADASSRVFAAAAPLALLEAIPLALREVGWHCESLSAAQGVWLDAVSDQAGLARGAVVALVGDVTHVLLLQDGRPTGARKIPARDTEGVLEALGHGPAEALVLAPGAYADVLHRALTPEGWRVSRASEGSRTAEAVTAGRARGGVMELLPPSLKQERRKSRVRAGLGMGIAAVALILASSVMHLWGAHRELRTLQVRRASIQAQVAPALLARDSLHELRDRVQTLRELAALEPLRTRAIVELSALLPEDTYLTAFFASGDTVELEAAGARAAETIQVLRSSGLFRDLRLQGIVERELYGGETVQERFRLRGRIPVSPGGSRP